PTSTEELEWVNLNRCVVLGADVLKELGNDLPTAPDLVLFLKGEEQEVWLLTGESEVVSSAAMKKAGYPTPVGEGALILELKDAPVSSPHLVLQGPVPDEPLLWSLDRLLGVPLQ
ncbi:MAG TPA: hypothetical protein VEV82_03915, partial [Actinomycetota bacterium]|nr:hypothetical protein [Actinomycetota bacterium]